VLGIRGGREMEGGRGEEGIRLAVEEREGKKGRDGKERGVKGGKV